MTCPTCHAPDCPHAAAPVTPEGELARLRREVERLETEVAETREAIEEVDALNVLLDAENTVLRHRLETLEPRREM